MHTFDIIQTVAFLLSFTALASRLFEASRPLWSRTPAWAQTLLPALVPAVTALAQGLAGVKSWGDLSVLFVVCFAMVLPGLPSNRSAARLQASKRPTGKPSKGDVAVAEVLVGKPSVAAPSSSWSGPAASLVFLLLGVTFALHQTACTHGLTPKTVNQAALILCDVFFAEQPQNLKLSVEDVEKAFCSTAEQLEPFLQNAQSAADRAGAVRLNRSEAPAQ